MVTEKRPSGGHSASGVNRRVRSSSQLNCPETAGVISSAASVEGRSIGWSKTNTIGLRRTSGSPGSGSVRISRGAITGVGAGVGCSATSVGIVAGSTVSRTGTGVGVALLQAPSTRDATIATSTRT